MGTINPALLIQNRNNLTAVCRIHIYGSPPLVNVLKDYRAAAVPPKHWCQTSHSNGGDGAVPTAVLGRGMGDSVLLGYSKPKPIGWAILSARVNITRQWNCSSASFQVAHPIEGDYDVKVPPVRPNDVIVIEMGYVAAHLTRIMRDNGRTDYSRFRGDVVFYGLVDTVKERGGSGVNDGVVFTVQARDMMRVLADNKIRANYTPTVSTKLNRAMLIRDLIYIGAQIDAIEWEPGDNWGRGVKPVEGTQAVLMRRPKKQTTGRNTTLVEAPIGVGNSYLTLGNIELSSRVDVIPVEPGKANEGMQIMDKFPLSVIKHFCATDAAPREVWSDPRTGEIHSMYRRTDARRLLDAGNPDVSASRQYFYRFPVDRANILSYTAEWSTLGTVTHWTLTNPISHIEGKQGAVDLYAESPMAVLRDPHGKNPDGTPRFLRPMTKNRFAFDDTLTEADSPQAVVGALFAIYGRALETGMVLVPGDPTLEVGEAVQVFNTGLFGRRANYKQENPLNDNEDTRGYQDTDYNPAGVHRVEAVQHLFAVGGPDKGYATAFVYGPADEDTGAIFTTVDSRESDEQKANSRPIGKRFIATDDEYVKVLTTNCLTDAQKRRRGI